MELNRRCEPIGFVRPGGFYFAASRHPELARSAGSNSGAPPQTPQNQTTPWAASISGKILFNSIQEKLEDLL
jgi:hypothetical protein